jgi:hypothetical protein
MKVKLELEAKQLEANLRRVHHQMEELGGSSGRGVASIQKGFKGAASQASNFIAILTGDKLTGATSQITAYAGALGAIPGPAGLATGAIVGTTAVAIAGTAALYGLTKAASDYGSVIHDVSQQTGLGAETISSLKIAADQSGSSIEQIAGSLAKFEKQISKSKDGLKEFGVTPQDALKDLDGSLAKVFTRIANAKPGYEQTTLAQKAFGKSGADLIPMIMSFDGDLPGLIAHLKELGLTMTDKDAAAADAFGDQMDTLEAQLAAAGRTIGMELMPVFSEFADRMSKWLVDNKGEIQSWGTITADTLSGVVSYWDEATAAISRYFAESRSFGNSPFNSGVSGGSFGDLLTAGIIGAPLLSAAGRGASDRERRAAADANVVRVTGDPGTYMSWHRRGSDGVEPGSGKIHKAPKESDAEFRKFFDELGFKVNRTFGGAINSGSPHPSGGAADLSVKGKTISDIFTVMARSIEKGYRIVDESGAKAAPGIKRTGPNVHVENAKTGLTKSSIFTNEKFSPEQVAYLKNLDQQRLGKASGMAGFEDFNKKKVEDAKKAADEELDIETKALNDWLDAERAAYSDRNDIRGAEANLAEEILKKQLNQGLIDEEEYQDRIGQLKIDSLQDERDELAEMIGTRENIVALQKLDLAIATAKLDKENKTLEAIKKQNEEREDMLRGLKKANQRPGGMKHRGEAGGFGAGIKDSIGGETWASQADMIASSTQRMGQIAGQAIGDLANAMGSLVANWVLYGGATEGGAKKAIAASLAMAASQSTVSAIMETAYGIAALTPWGAAIYGPAALHFKSAALFGIVAAGTALGGRALAGDSFKKDSGGGRASGSSGGGGSSSSSSPDPYSRVSRDAYMSGSHGGQRLTATLDRLDSTLARLEPMKAGDVLARGIGQRPGLVIDTATKEAKGGRGRPLASSLGLR